VANALRRTREKTLPRSREAVNAWGIPTFNFNGPLCYMMQGKQQLTLGFMRGTSLADDAGLLEGTGKKPAACQTQRDRATVRRESQAVNCWKLRVERENAFDATQMRAKKKPVWVPLCAKTDVLILPLRSLTKIPEGSSLRAPAPSNYVPVLTC